MGKIFKGPGYLIFIICGIWGLFICFGIVQNITGTLFAFLSLFLFPLVATLAPLYEGVVNGNWFPLLLIYGGGILSMTLIAIGSKIDGD